jgi:chromosome segregation ATPase
MSSLLLTIQEMRVQIEELSEYRGKYERAARQTEKYRVKLHGSESVCQSQQSLIEMQATEINKVKHKVRKYKKKVQQRDSQIASMLNQISRLEGRHQ